MLLLSQKAKIGLKNGRPNKSLYRVPRKDRSGDGIPYNFFILICVFFSDSDNL